MRIILKSEMNGKSFLKKVCLQGTKLKPSNVGGDMSMCTTKNEKVSDKATLFLLPISSVLILATFFVCIVGCVAVRCFIPWSATSEKVLVPALSVHVCRWMPFSLIGPIVFMFITAIMRIKKPSASAVLWFFAFMTGYLFTVLFFCSLAISLYCLLKFGSL